MKEDNRKMEESIRSFELVEQIMIEQQMVEEETVEQPMDEQRTEEEESLME